MKRQVLANVSEALRNMKYSLDNYKASNNHNKIIYLRNCITTGRSVTFVIQTLKNIVGEETFNEWYEPWQEKMKQDQILKTFVTIRNEIEKQGKLDTSLSMHIEHLNSNDLQPLMQNPPPHAVGFFIGDQIGGSGWEINYGDGITEKIYAELPKEVKLTIDFDISKLSNLNNGLSTLEMLEHYYNFMLEIYKDAQKTFVAKKNGYIFITSNFFYLVVKSHALSPFLE